MKLQRRLWIRIRSRRFRLSVRTADSTAGLADDKNSTLRLVRVFRTGVADGQGVRMTKAYQAGKFPNFEEYLIGATDYLESRLTERSGFLKLHVARRSRT